MNSLHPVFERALRPFAPSFFPNIGAAQQAALRPDALGTQARIALSEEELLAAAERLRQSINQRRAERQEAVT